MGLPNRGEGGGGPPNWEKFPHFPVFFWGERPLFLSLLTESMLTVGLELRIVIIVVIVVGILLLMVLLCYLYHRRNKAGIKGELVYLH